MIKCKTAKITYCHLKVTYTSNINEENPVQFQNYLLKRNTVEGDAQVVPANKSSDEAKWLSS